MAAIIRVLVIDDDLDDCRFIKDLLDDSSRATFTVDSVGSAAEGIQKLKSEAYDVVLLDYKLPDSDGLSALRQIGTGHYRVPVVIVTSHGDRNLQVRALEEGAAEYLEKGSFNADLLERTCIYAIGLREKQVHGDSGPGVGILIEQLVDLTRESVKAQESATQEIRELRKELGTGIRSIRRDIETQGVQGEAQHTKVIQKIEDQTRIRWVLDWIAAHPTAAIVIFLALALLVFLVVSAIQIIDLDKLIEIRKATSGLVPDPAWDT